MGALKREPHIELYLSKPNTPTRTHHTLSVPHHCRSCTSIETTPSKTAETLSSKSTNDHASLKHHHFRNLHNLILLLNGQESDRETPRQTPLLVRRRLSMLHHPLHGHVKDPRAQSKGMYIGDE